MEKTILEKLEKIKECDNKLVKRVIDDAVDQGEDAQTWLNDVRSHGCVSGCVSGLIYYNDTNEFFNEFIEEIQDAFEEYTDGVGEQPKIDTGNIRNWFAWFGYEWAVNKVLDMLENHEEDAEEE